MGNMIPVTCEVCFVEYGEKAIFKVYHHGLLGGHNICIDCYHDNKYLDNFKNKLSHCNRIRKCDNCGYKNKNVSSKKLLKIHWYGKFGNNILFDQCVFDKEYRKKNRKY